MKLFIIRLLSFGIPILLGVMVFMYFASQRKPPVHAKPEEYSALVRTITSKKVPALPKISGYGTVRPKKVWNAVAQVSGKVLFVHPKFRKGSIIPEQTEIIRISPKDYVLAVQQSEANIRSAKAKMNELKVQAENTKSSLKIEETSLSLKRKDLQRKRRLLRRGTVAQATYDSEQRALLTQSQQVQNLKNSLKLIPSQINAQQEQISVSQSQLETAQLNLQRTRIKMPFAGLVSDQQVEETQFVSTGQVLGAADGMDTSEIDVQIPSEKAQTMMRMLIGDKKITGINKDTLPNLVSAFDLKALVKMEVGKQNVIWEGNIVRISDTMDPKTRTVGVVVAVNESYKRAIPGFRPPLVKGTFVEVTLSANAKKSINVVPRSAIHDNKIYLVNSDNRLQIHPITIVFTQGPMAMISEDIPDGTPIVVSALTPAINGMRLIMEKDEKAEKELYQFALSDGSEP